MVDISQETIKANYIEIILGTDDIVAVGGYRESVNMSLIQQYLKMESQEEKAFLILKNQRENEQKEVLRKKMKEFEKEKQDKRFQKIESNYFNKYHFSL